MLQCDYAYLISETERKKGSDQMFLEVFIVLFTYFFIVFIIGQLLKNNSIVDIAWGFGYVVAALYSFFRGNPFMQKSSFITVAILIWGLRLTYHIGRRNIGKPEDYRYVEMREKWGDKFPIVQAFFKVYMLQFIIMFIVSLPLTYGNSTSIQKFQWFNYIGILLWATGLFFESYGDYQLKKFKKNPDNKGKLMDKGLWSLTRHPNYFGDSMMWTGIFFVALSGWSSIWIVVGPALMTYMIVFISGVRLLEKKYEGRSDYEDYKKRTNSFIPGPPRKNI
jgi:steroid 5-alpha reductase family enzyme